jgi:hypothetical protein
MALGARSADTNAASRIVTKLDKAALVAQPAVSRAAERATVASTSPWSERLPFDLFSSPFSTRPQRRLIVSDLRPGPSGSLTHAA